MTTTLYDGRHVIAAVPALAHNAGMSRSMVRRLLSILLVSSLAVAGIAFLHWLRGLPDAQLDRSDQISSSLGPPIALASLVVAVASLWATRQFAGPSWTRAEQDAAIRDHLAEQTRPLLNEEATRRDLHPPYLQPVRWIGDTARGDIDELAALYRSLQARQLVIVGASGSGKSSMALRLAIDLLATEDAAADPVPHLINLSTWSSDQKLDTWLRQSLERQFPDLADSRRLGKGAIERAVDQVLPILDGFDELPAGARPVVLRHLRGELAAGRPIVLVAGKDAFQAAIERSGVTLPRATVVTVQPLDVTLAAAFLVAGQPNGQIRWREVLQRLADKPQGGLARLLSSPLSIYLVRKVYEDPQKDPRDLLTMRISQARGMLMRSYLPAVYGEWASRVDGSLHRYPPEQAERWLRELARRMVAAGTPNLAWWQLLALSKGAAVALRAVVFVTAGVFLTARYSLVTGVVVAFAARSVVGGLTLPRAAPAKFVPKVRPLVVAGASSAVAGVAAAMFLWSAVGPLVSALAGLWIGLVLLVGISGGLGGLQDRRPGDVIDPRRELRNDRTAYLLLGVAIPLLSGIRSAVQWNWWWMGVQQFARTAIFLLIVIGLANIGVPWLRFAWARLVLAATGRTPIRLLRFLDDAHRRGVLRRSGTAYEFRHAAFLTYLAGTPPDRPPGADPLR